MWDFFISHASEDKDGVARPIAEMLRDRGHNVWFDEFTLKLGDNLRRSIEQGLVQSRFGVVILSPNFFAKKWTNLELDGLVALERDNEKRILPVWHNVTVTDIEQRSSWLALRLGVPTSRGIDHIVNMIEKAVDAVSHPASKDHDSDELSLHPHSLELLAAARAGDGRIVFSEYMSGYSLSAGGQDFGQQQNPRAEALHRHCLEELSNCGLIEAESDSLFSVTQEGFDFEVPVSLVPAQTPEFPQLKPANYPVAKELMQSAVGDNGIVMFSEFIGGETLQGGHRAWGSNRDQRKVAGWKSTLRELVSTGLLMQVSDSMYHVTHLGYLWTDAINAADAPANHAASRS